MKAQSMRVLALCSFAALGACADEGAGPEGPGVTIEVAPLSLPATTGTEYALAVFNALPTNPIFLPAGTVVTAGNIAALVWNQSSVTSNQFGNGAGGDISYVGPCDASLGGPSTNYIALALKQVAVGVNGGSFTGSGPNTPAINNTVFATVSNNILDDQNTAIGGSNVLSADSDPDFENPCPYDDPCVLDFPCKENQDVAVVFNLTIMRDANQGFFDIAVNFEDIFCSAKFDTCYEEGDLPIELLFGDDTDTNTTLPDALGDEPGRDWTGVYAMACTAGAQSGVITDILMSAVAVTCPTYATFNLPISGLTQPAGNHTVTTPFGIVQYATYYGQETLLCPIPGFPNNPCNKAYFNIAINLEDLPAGCTLSLQATVQDSANPAFTGGFPTTFADDSGTTYPYVNVVAAPLSQACTQNPLNGGDGKVSTFYGSTMNTGTPPSVMTDHSANGADPAVISVPAVADTTRPTVNVVTPADGTTGVGIGTDITVTFSEAMLASTINANSIRLAKRGATLSDVSAAAADTDGSYFVTSVIWLNMGYLENNLVLVGSADATLPSGFYRVRLLQDFKLYLADLSGNAVDFSATARADLTPFNWVAGVVTASGASATFNPDFDLINATNYLGIVVNTAKDAAGNALLNNYFWNFTAL